MSHTGLYRVRRGIFGCSVLQELMDYPSYSGGFVDAHCREFVWEDVKYKAAPRALISQWGDTHDKLTRQGDKPT